MDAEHEFVEQLRTATETYLHSVDEWEASYAKYYRLHVPGRVNSDIEEQQKRYDKAKREFERLLPQAIRLCRKYDLRNPWESIRHIELGPQVPQGGNRGSIGQGERRALRKCLEDLEELTAAPSKPVEFQPEPEPPRRTGVFGWLYEKLF